jgi:two-component system response regulator YesN
MIPTIIVDDEHLARKGLRTVFPWERFGFRIVGEAASGDKALALIREQQVQLVVTDITMPKMSGLELMKRLKLEAPSVRVVVVTCHQDFDYIQDALRLGAIDYIVKTQLEEQNLDEVLLRIAGRFQAESSKPAESTAPPTREEAPPPGKSEELKGSLLWIVDDERYRPLADALASSPSRVIREALAGWQTYLHSFPLWEEAADKLDMLPPEAWLEETRKELRKWLRRSSYSEEMISGIVRSLELMRQDRDKGEISQSNICKRVGISKGYFSKAFKDVVGIPFSHYVQHVYIEAAKEWLVETNHTVYWIAERCGFADTRYFSKVFREHTGMLPSEYRQSQSSAGV